MKNTNKKRCDNCNLLFDENDVDLEDGKWLCRKCEEDN
jgi:formylmethanofuran dehydrogenase subunit E